MDINQIKSLLCKYFDGKSTLIEERLLHEYFEGDHEIPAEMASYKHQLLLLKTGGDYVPDMEQFESRFDDIIDQQATSMKHLFRQRRFKWFMVAASLAILIGLSFMIVFQAQKHGHKDTYSDPQVAYNETKKALIYVSQMMNDGIEPLSNLSKINTGTDKLKSLEKMNIGFEMLNKVSYIESIVY